MRIKTREIVSFFKGIRKELTFGLIITLLLSIILFVVKEVRDANREEERIPPIFIVVDPILKVGEKITIRAGNKRAERNEYLNVKYDGYIFESAGKPMPKTTKKSKQQWEFDLKRQRTTAKMLEEGEHSISFAFQGETFSGIQKITFVPGEDSTDGGGIFLIIFIVILVVGGVIVYMMTRKPPDGENGPDDDGNDLFNS